MTRWHHGHSLVTGALLGLLVFRAGELWPLTIMFAFGLVLGRLWWRIGQGLAWLASSRSPFTPGQWRKVRRRVDVLRPDDRIPF